MENQTEVQASHAMPQMVGMLGVVNSICASPAFPEIDRIKF